MSAELLFALVKRMLDEGRSTTDVATTIKSDEELIAASASYCEQCGECCGPIPMEGADERKFGCANLYFGDDGIAYCLLHSDGYPDGKTIADIAVVADHILSPSLWAKPLHCHTYGPYVTLLTLLTEKDPALLSTLECVGGKKMFADYKAF